MKVRYGAQQRCQLDRSRKLRPDERGKDQVRRTRFPRLFRCQLRNRDFGSALRLGTHSRAGSLEVSVGLAQ